MATKKSSGLSAPAKLIIWIVALVVVGYVGISFIRGYMAVGAASLILPTGYNSIVKNSSPTDTVCSTCAETGWLAPKCAGSCPAGQDCKLVIDTGTCTCV